MCGCFRCQWALFSTFTVMSLLPLHHIAYERVGASHKRTNPSNEEGLDREVGAKNFGAG